jgi:AcrR family transcriptional regulator
MKAARRLFTEQGYAATSLDAVAAAGRVTKGSLYHHFSDKRELFEAVFEAEARAVFDRVVEALARKRDPLQAAYTGIATFLDVSQEPSVQRIMLLDAPSVLGWERTREIEGRYGLALIRASLAQLRAAGRIKRHDPDSLAHILFAALSEGALAIARADDPPGMRRKFERQIRQLLDALAL